MGMFGRCVEKAIRTLVDAKHEADRFGSLEISPEHILLALLRDSTLTSARMEGVSVREISEALRANLPRLVPNPLPHDLPLSSTAGEVLVLAEEEANKLGHRAIRNDHLLLGLLSSKNSYAAELLAQKGLSVDELRRQVESTSF